MLNVILVFIIICLVIILGIVSAHFKEYKKKIADIQAVYDGDWGPWSEVKYHRYPGGRDMYDGSYVAPYTIPYQDRTHTKTGEYERQTV